MARCTRHWSMVLGAQGEMLLLLLMKKSQRTVLVRVLLLSILVQHFQEASEHDQETNQQQQHSHYRHVQQEVGVRLHHQRLPAAAQESTSVHQRAPAA